MFNQYGVSLTGRSHQKTGTPCQDAHLIRPLKQDWMLCAVSDGVGSAERAEEGAGLAVQTLGDWVEGRARNIQEERPCLLWLQEGFAAAEEKIRLKAEQAGCPEEAYDCTLTAVLYNGEQVLVGHCGDGGVIGMDPQGMYHCLTQPQKGENWNEVVPLRRWAEYGVFQQGQDPYDGVLLLTDGLYDLAMPLLLKNEACACYCRFVHRLLPPDLGRKDQREVGCHVSDLIRFLYSEECEAITDDMTAVAVAVRGRNTEQPPPDYLQEPDWAALRLHQYRLLYPHLKLKERQSHEPEQQLDSHRRKRKIHSSGNAFCRWWGR